MLTPDGFAEHFLGMNLYPKQKQALRALAQPGAKVSFASCNEGGKALSIDTPIPTPDGWKTMGELQVGDSIFGSDGKPYQVTFVTEVMYGNPCNRVVFNDGSEIIADDDHQWLTEYTTTGPTNFARTCKKEKKVSTTKQIAETLRYGYEKWGAFAHAIPICEPLCYSEKKLPIPPYTFGVWLGDGSSGDGCFHQCEADSELVEHVKNDGFHVVSKKTRTSVRHTLDSRGAGFKNTFHKKISALGVLNNKHIPENYLRGSIHQRTELLKGLMDTDGYIDKKRAKCEFCNTNERLANQVLELILSLGIKATMGVSDAKLYGRIVSKKYRISFTTSRQVFKLSRKAKLIRNFVSHGAKRMSCRRIVSVVPIASVPVKCIQVNSPNECYLAGKNFITTHNTKVVVAAFVLWHMAMYPKGTVDATSGSYRQIEDQLMPALTSHKDKFPKFQFMADPFITTDMFKKDGVQGGFFRGFSTDQQGRAEGDHNAGEDAPLAYIVDEAKSCQPWLRGVIEGRVRPERLLICSSHGFAEGWFYESQTIHKDMYTVICQTAEDCPHISPKTIAEVRAKWPGPFGDSILGYGFIPLVEDAIFHYKDVDWCMQAKCVEPKFGKVGAFCDFAWSNDGDESTLAVCNGNVVKLEACFRSDSLHGVCDRFVQEFIRLGLTPNQIYGDNGGGGTLVMDELDRRGWRLNRVDNGFPAKDSEHYVDLASEMWYEAGKLISGHKVQLPSDTDLRFQLLNRKRVAGSKGRLKMESKSAMKERGVMSPDRADAVLMAIYCAGNVLPSVSAGLFRGVQVGSYKMVGA